MGQYAVLSFKIGVRMGMASYAFSIRDFGQGSAHVATAANYLHGMNPLIAFDPFPVNNEQATVKARVDIANLISRSAPPLGGIYQMGLHIGLALGQSGANKNDWPIASKLCKTGLSQAVDDAKHYEFLRRANIDVIASNLGQSVNPTQPDPSVASRINSLILMIDDILQREASVL